MTGKSTGAGFLWRVAFVVESKLMFLMRKNSSDVIAGSSRAVFNLQVSVSAVNHGYKLRRKPSPCRK
ncbi:MAG: hypothetical protein ACK58L_03145 [Planctomycetota bacterium]